MMDTTSHRADLARILSGLIELEWSFSEGETAMAQRIQQLQEDLKIILMTTPEK